MYLILANTVGFSDQVNHPDVLTEVKRCQKIIESNGIALGSMATDIDYVKMLKELDYKFIAYLKDAAAMKFHFY